MRAKFFTRALLLLIVLVLAPIAPVFAMQTYEIDPAQSRVTYRVDETFFGGAIRRGTAVGVTQAVEGTIHFDVADPASISAGPVRVDISQFKSDQQRRDERIRREWLESSRYPVAEFVVTAVEPLQDVTLGEEIPVRVHGNLTVRDVTRPTTFEGVLVLGEDEIRGSFQTRVFMTDFGFEPPNIAGVLQAENDVDVEFEFVAVRRPESR